MPENELPTKTPEGKTIVYYEPQVRKSEGVIIIDTKTGARSSIDQTLWSRWKNPEAEEYKGEVEYRRITDPRIEASRKRIESPEERAFAEEQKVIMAKKDKRG